MLTHLSLTEFQNEPLPRRSFAMRKLALTTILVLATAAISSAQNTANTNVPVNATVIQGLTLIVTGGPLNFGSIVAGTTPAAIVAKSSTVYFTATGDGGHLVGVTFPAMVSMTGPGTALTFTPSVYGANNSGGQSSSTQVTSSTSVNLSGSTGSAGNYYFWLGGQLNAIPSGQTIGSYSGTFTLTVTYQ